LEKSKLLLIFVSTKQTTMTPEFTSAEKVIYKAEMQFHLKNGDTELEAIQKAMGKILNVRMFKNKVGKYFKH